MGLSTSLMVNKMKAAAKELNFDADIEAMPADEYESEPVKCDVLLIAPQMSYKTQDFKDEYGSSVKLIEEISQQEYGLMKGMDVLKRVISELEK